MNQGRVLWTILFCACPLAGCSQSGASGTSGPDQVVHEFLDAVRRGDDEKAGGLLTKVMTQRHAYCTEVSRLVQSLRANERRSRSARRGHASAFVDPDAVNTACSFSLAAHRLATLVDTGHWAARADEVISPAVSSIR